MSHKLTRVSVGLLVAAGLLVAVPLASASDASLKHALKGYQSRLTTDIAYLASFSAPSKGSASGVLHRLSKITGDLSGATRAANGHQASSSSGRKGRSEILTALHDATTATGDARASANAARAGNRSAAKRAAKQEQRDINKAIPLFESGGKLLHLF